MCFILINNKFVLRKKGEKRAWELIVLILKLQPTKLASKGKKGVNQTTSFGIKMNNQHATQNDRVSFGGPFDLFNDVFLGGGDDIAEGFGELTASAH